MSGHLEHDQYYAWISIMLLKSKLQSDPVFFSNLDRAELKNDNVVWDSNFEWLRFGDTLVFNISSLSPTFYIYRSLLRDKNCLVSIYQNAELLKSSC